MGARPSADIRAGEVRPHRRRITPPHALQHGQMKTIYTYEVDSPEKNAHALRRKR